MNKEKKNKIFDFKGLFKNFVSGASEEESERDIILNDDSLSVAEKEELLGKIDFCENLSHELFVDNLKSVKNVNFNKNVDVKNTKININKEISNKKEKGKDRNDD